MARNLTPETNGLPEGLTEAEFIKVMRTGEDIHCEKEPTDPICSLPEPGPQTFVLQVMPWPTYHSMTDADLKAIYAYLTAIPPGQCVQFGRRWLSRIFGNRPVYPQSLCLSGYRRLPKPGTAPVVS